MTQTKESKSPFLKKKKERKKDKICKILNI